MWWYPHSGVLLLGDCFYPPPYHLRQPGDTYDAALIRSLLDESTFGRLDWYVDSHSHPRTPQQTPALLSTLPH
ncbi:hypothetical protein [Micromonospora cremea]|uniref:Metallo-beta-lactamase superfamily protein n=1 Tax=Micromonospora cremea TaxID=709881 RepID=A0A1N6A5A1_9ACTN|nr:hypothetical protein [Micromonospora cremea]SIN29238.1 hypothetical protein SAMN04489832_4971 [Micromonospora cremea]